MSDRVEQMLRDRGMLAAETTVQEVMVTEDAGNITQVAPIETYDYAEIDAITMGAPPAARFDEVDALVSGEITRVIARQATDFDTREPKWFEDGRPIMEAVVTMETADGPCTLYCGSKGLRDAIREACRDAGMGLRPKGHLAVRRVADGEPFKKGAKPPKQYDAAYDPPLTLARKVEQDRTVVEQNVRTTVLAQGSDPPF